MTMRIMQLKGPLDRLDLFCAHSSQLDDSVLSSRTANPSLAFPRPLWLTTNAMHN